MTEIVKVQVPLFSSDPNALPLVYDRHRKHQVMQEIDSITRKAMGNDVKAYFEADYRHAESKWFFGKRVKDREW